VGSGVGTSEGVAVGLGVGCKERPRSSKSGHGVLNRPCILDTESLSSSTSVVVTTFSTTPSTRKASTEVSVGVMVVRATVTSSLMY
jgi:hypothetical protein